MINSHHYLSGIAYYNIKITFNENPTSYDRRKVRFEALRRKKRNYSSLEINNDRLQKFQVTWKWIQASQINLLKHTDKNKKYIDILKIKNIIF